MAYLVFPVSWNCAYMAVNSTRHMVVVLLPITIDTN